jgi:hypothetical protein
MDEGARLKSVWIKKKSFPIPLLYLNEFEKQVNDFGVVLENDQRTSSHKHFREARREAVGVFYERLRACRYAPGLGTFIF